MTREGMRTSPATIIVRADVYTPRTSDTSDRWVRGACALSAECVRACVYDVVYLFVIVVVLCVCVCVCVCVRHVRGQRECSKYAWYYIEVTTYRIRNAYIVSFEKTRQTRWPERRRQSGQQVHCRSVECDTNFWCFLLMHVHTHAGARVPNNEIIISWFRMLCLLDYNLSFVSRKTKSQSAQRATRWK